MGLKLISFWISEGTILYNNLSFDFSQQMTFYVIAIKNVTFHNNIF